MDYVRGSIFQHGADRTGVTEIGLKVHAGSGRFDFWGGALRIPRHSGLALDKGELRLNDGRSARVMVDFAYDDENGRIVTFFGCSTLEAAPACAVSGS